MKKLIKFRFTDSFKESGLATGTPIAGTPIERFIEMNEYFHSRGEGFWYQILYGCACVNDFDVDFIEKQLAGLSICLFIKYIVPHIKNLYMVCMNNYPVLTAVVSLFFIIWIFLFFLIGLVYDADCHNNIF